MKIKILVIKLAGCLLLALGIILTLACLVSAVAVFVYFPDSNIGKVALAGSGLLLAAIIIGLVTFALFTLVEGGAKDIDEHESHLDTWQRKHQETNKDKSEIKDQNIVRGGTTTRLDSAVKSRQGTTKSL